MTSYELWITGHPNVNVNRESQVRCIRAKYNKQLIRAGLKKLKGGPLVIESF